jgi:hypothetical protein
MSPARMIFVALASMSPWVHSAANRLSSSRKIASLAAGLPSSDLRQPRSAHLRRQIVVRGKSARALTRSELRVAWRRGLEKGLAADSSEVVPYKILPYAIAAVEGVVKSRLRLFSQPS